MEGAARELFVPLSLAVGFAMVTSYILSSTFVPVCGLAAAPHLPPRRAEARRAASPSTGCANGMHGFLRSGGAAAVAGLILPAYLVGRGPNHRADRQRSCGTEIFPRVDSGQFQLASEARGDCASKRTEEMAKRGSGRDSKRRRANRRNVRRLSAASRRRVTRSTRSTCGPPAPKKSFCASP